MIGRPNFNHPFAKAVIDRVKESLVVYQQRMKGIVVSVAADGKSAVVRRYEEPTNVQKKPYVNTVAGLAAGDEVVCMVDRGGGVITGVVGGKAGPGGGSSAITMIPNGQTLSTGLSVPSSPGVLTPDARSLSQVSLVAKGVVVLIEAPPSGGASIRIDQGDLSSLGTRAPRMALDDYMRSSQQFLVGLPANGTLRLQSSGPNIVVDVWVTGYWT